MELELGKIKSVINTVHFGVVCRADMSQQVSPVVLRAGDHGLGPLDFGAKKVWAAQVDVLGVRGEGVRNAGELMSEHGNQGRSVGKVRMKMSDWLPK